MRNLLTKNDLAYLQSALDSGRFVLMERELLGLRLTVSTRAAPRWRQTAATVLWVPPVPRIITFLSLREISWASSMYKTPPKSVL